MKINITLAVVFLSFTLLAYSGLFQIPPTERIGCTELNGDGCVCHSLYADPSVEVWVEGPETLAVGQTGLYKMFLTGGPAEAGGYNVAGRFGTMKTVDSISVWDYRAPNELTQAFPLLFPTPQDTIFWPFEYTASDSSDVDTIYSCGLSIVYDSIPDFYDKWAFGPKFPLTIIEAIPVELTSFSVELNDKNAILKWRTVSELNNRGFEIERLQDYKITRLQNWEKIGFVEGKGTTSETSEYSFIDKNLTNGKNLYRLKQIDYDGRFQYSEIVELNAEGLFNFELSQNYPNPFNPSTVISWQLAVSSYVTLIVYDILGNEVVTLISEERSAGKHEVEFNASKISSGLYFYMIKAGDFTEKRKMLFIK
ncbi:MAG: hypothetical protein A2V93_00380 [Ignavibacteria bacterium RBG_16_34_14]|nr:MAG: hypothetical protein A2V93_00380 [Ignavibacteria bacterium RBG_16_34_14]